MASVEKYAMKAVTNQIRHNERLTLNPANKDINLAMSGQNYLLSPDRGMTSYDYFLKRKEELYCYKRDDVKVMAGWVVSAPRDLPVSVHGLFFKETYDFLANRYHEENIVSAMVHKDESGQPHLHCYFIPAVADQKHDGEKICANDILNKKELRNFHPDLQKYLNDHGVNAKVLNGATAGGNKTVRELKRERDISHERVLVF